MWFCFFCSAVSGACGLLLLPDPFGELPPVPSSEGADIVFCVGCFWVVVAEQKREGGDEVGAMMLLLIPGEGVVETNDVGWVDVCCMKGG